VIDKSDVISKISSKTEVVLELGCGKNKKEESFIGIDKLDYPCVDIVGDVFEVLLNFPDDSVDKIYTSHFVEHIPNLAELLIELSRVVKSGGEVEIIAPHFSNPHFYSDYTHTSFFGIYTLSYLSVDSIFKRRVPDYQEKKMFNLVSVDIIFKSNRPFYFRHLFKKTIGLIFNSCSYLKEFYEENLCYIFPCYEVKYVLQKI
jgi:ubiquinone/menaquinone biosynthesis C-methylase UbiE